MLRIGDYVRLGCGLGFQDVRSSGNSGTWLGVEYGGGLQGLLRVSDLVDVGARFYWAFITDKNFIGLDKCAESGIRYASGHSRIGKVYVDFSRGVSRSDKNTFMNLNITLS